MASRRVSRRQGLRVIAVTAAWMALLWPASALASPLHLNVQSKERSNDIRLKIYASVHLGGANINNHYLGTYYVKKNGSTKRVNANLLGIAAMVLRMSYNAQKRYVKILSDVSVANYKARKTIIENLK